MKLVQVNADYLELEVIMHLVKIEWCSIEDGGRKEIPSKGRYFSVAKIPGDISSKYETWSVVFELESLHQESGKFISTGKFDFLMDTAPQEKMRKSNTFEIYEGPKKVAKVTLLS